MLNLLLLQVRYGSIFHSHSLIDPVEVRFRFLFISEVEWGIDADCFDDDDGIVIDFVIILKATGMIVMMMIAFIYVRWKFRNNS